MKRQLAFKARKAYANAPLVVQKAFDKQVKILLENLQHPSLRAKKYDETYDIWQARVNRYRRFYFTIQEDICLILDIIRHPK